MKLENNLVKIDDSDDAAIGNLYYHRFKGKRFRISDKEWLIPIGHHWQVVDSSFLNKDFADLEKHIKENYSTSESKVIDILKKMRNTPGIKNLIWWLNSFPDMLIEHNKLNCHPDKLALANGVYDMKTHEFIGDEDETRKLMFTKHIPVSYDANAECPRFRQFLDEIFASDEDLISYLLRLIAQSLLGCPKEELAVFFLGKQQNGKTTMLNLMKTVFGEYYDVFNQSLAFTKGQPRGQERWEKAYLKGLKIAVIDELEKGCEFNSALFKQITTRSKIKADVKNKELINIDVSHTLFVSTNHMPQVCDDAAVLRRVCVIPFDYVVPEEKKDRDLDKKLAAEAPGVLNMLLESLREYTSSGLGPKPQRVRNAMKRYVKADTLSLYLDDCYCAGDALSKIPLKELFDDYQKWCAEFQLSEESNIHSSKQCSGSLRKLGYRVKNSTGNATYVFGLNKKDKSSDLKEP